MNESTNQPEQQSDPVIPEILREETAVARTIPVTLDELANLPEEQGLEKVENRVKIVQALRRASIELTNPQDWLLFKSPDGAVTAFLQDSGCGRILPLWGIDIEPKNGFTRIDDEKDGEFAYECCADGFCNATGRFVKDVTGVRYSTEDFCKNLPPLLKDVRVKQASVANRNGNIVRALAGMKGVALEELQAVWGTRKSIDKCSLGKGYGSKADRQGAGGVSAATPKDIPAPICETCQKTMKFIDGTGKNYKSFWACPDKKKVDGKWNEHSSINDEEYRKKLAASAAERTPGQEG